MQSTMAMVCMVFLSDQVDNDFTWGLSSEEAFSAR